MMNFTKWAFGRIGAAIVATFIGYLLTQIIWRSEDSPQFLNTENSNISIEDNNNVGGDIVGGDKITVN